MKEVVIHNWNELQEAIFQNAWDDNLMRYRSNFVFRGLSDANINGFVPKLNRYVGHNLAIEDSMLRNFKKYAYDKIGSYNHFWETVTLAQHYGLPTRLLDWSYSPLVAAHFATENIEKYDRDGMILCLNFVKLKEMLPERLKKSLKEEKSNSFTQEMLENLVPSFGELMKAKNEPFALFFEPSSMRERISNQYSLFSVTSYREKTLDQLIDLDNEDIFYKIIIPKEVKLEIRDKLDYINISERTIYPGIEGICRWMTRRYADLGPKYNKKHHMEEEQ